MKRSWITIIGAALILALVGSWAVLRTLPDLPPKTVIFLSVGLDRNFVANSVSPYEMHRATEHFSNVVLGWTVEPSFASEFGETAFSGRRQEKENLLFTLQTDDSAIADQFVDLIEERLFEYNAASASHYVLALKKKTVLEIQRADGRIFLGVLLLTGLASFGILMLYEKSPTFGHRSEGTH